MMNMKKAYKYRIYPTRSQETRILNQFSMCRYLYNWALKERIEVYQSTKKSINYYHQANWLPQLKKERPWFKSIHSQVLQNVLKRLDKAFKDFFRRVKKGEIPGFPKYKKRGQWNSITYPQFYDRPVVEGRYGYIRVPKIGQIKIRYHREIPTNAKIKTLTISYEAGKWFACFSFEQELEVEPKQELPPIGIDMGLLDFVYASNGLHVPCPKHLRRKEQNLRKLQRRFSRERKYTPRWYKLLKAIQKTHYRIRCARLDFLHKTVNLLLSHTDLVVCEKLKIKNMVRRPKPIQDENGKYLPNGASWKAGLNKSILDAGWSKFFDILIYKALEQGKKVLFVNPRQTSQICSNCGCVVSKSLSIRTHVCPECGFVANRDHNAALNILRLGLQSLRAPC